MNHRARGVSLIEVMVTVAVLAIITVASIPSFTIWGANSRVRAAAEAMQNGVRLAQAEGVRSNTSVTLRLTEDPVPGSETPASSKGINWILLDSTGTKVLQRKGREGVTDVSMTPSDGKGGSVTSFNGNIVFTGLGQNDLTKTLFMEFTSTAADRPLTVIVTPGGRVRMCDAKRPLGDPQACE